ncbi:MAG: cytochrome C biogenesis protein [Phycisphaerae bacterium]|nr:cytochrome C biogenesis protein [Phycisphaerae bacterium]
MIEKIFISLNSILEQGSLWSLAACFLWGILSILLSPCHLASIPLIVGFVGHQGKISRKDAFLISFLFSFGILLTISIIGGVTSFAGRMLGDVGAAANYFVAVVFFAVGLLLLDVIKMPWSAPAGSAIKKKGLWGGFLLGLIFGIALGPCTFAYLAPLMAIAFKTGGSNVFYGAGLLILYGIGHCSVIVLAGTFTEVVQQYMDWNEKSLATLILRRICGVLIILAGLYMIYKS